MIVRSVGTLELSRRAKAAGISISHWSSRICRTTRSVARSARTNASFSFIAGAPLCEPLKCRSSACSHASIPCAAGERPSGSLRSHCDGLITPRASAIAADRLPGVSGSLRPARLIIAIAGALLIAYAVIWTQVSSFDVGRSDFTAFYVGGTLLREGHTGDLYSQAEQQPLHSELIAPDREGDLPFVNTPVAAALVLPVTFLPLAAAYRVWSVLELAVIVIAVVLAVRTGEWPAGTPRLWKAAAGAAALTGMGTWTMFVQAQWTPLLALGLVLAYRSWKGGHMATGAAVLVGSAGVAGFFSILASSTTRWELATMVSFIGVVGSVFGNGMAAHLIGLAVSLVACAAAAWLGMTVRRDPSHLDTALAGAAVLSLIASPHAYPDDLVMLAPALVIGFAAAARRAGPTSWLS